MTLFSTPRATKVLVLAVALVAGGMATARARDGQPGIGWSDGDVAGRMLTRKDRHGQRDWRPRDRHRYDGGRAARHDGHGRWTSGDFYGGAISAFRDPGNGTYFYIDGDRYSDDVGAPFVEKRGPKVIVVTPGGNGCSWEAGVCVIRP
jgi:hypothetical protein